MSELTLEQAQGQIAILLEEYRAIRDDINGRVSAQATVSGFSVAGLAVLLGLKDTPLAVYVIVAIGLALTVFVVAYGNSRWIGILGDRLEEIEKAVNDLARDALSADFSLLQWQTGVNQRGPLFLRWLK